MTKPSKHILFRCDASQEIGSGHVMRCLTLADIFAQNGWTCSFMSSSETIKTVSMLERSVYPVMEPAESEFTYDILVIDHYGLDHIFAQSMRGRTGKIMVIDDLADRHHDCDVLLDQTYGRKAEDYKALVPADAQILVGTHYALLRPQFAGFRSQAEQKRKHIKIPKNLLISLGGTNIGNATNLILEIICDLEIPPLDVKVVLGRQAMNMDDVKHQIQQINNDSPHHATLHLDVQNMAQYMLDADLAIGAGGTTSWERCCLGLPTLLIELADNQAKISAELDRVGAVWNFGVIENLNEPAFLNKMSDILSNPEQLTKCAQSALSVCDGQGANRVYEILIS